MRLEVAELAGRIEESLAREKRYAASGRWNLRREARDQRHRMELRRAAFERRLKGMEAPS